MIDQMGGAFGHAAAAATGTKSTTLAREGHETILAALITMESSKPTRQAATGQKVAELLFDESGQAFTVAQRRRLEAERLEVRDDNLMKHAVSGIPRLIAAGRLRHSTGEGGLRANH